MVGQPGVLGDEWGPSESDVPPVTIDTRPTGPSGARSAEASATGSPGRVTSRPDPVAPDYAGEAALGQATAGQPAAGQSTADTFTTDTFTAGRAAPKPVRSSPDSAEAIRAGRRSTDRGRASDAPTAGFPDDARRAVAGKASVPDGVRRGWFGGRRDAKQDRPTSSPRERSPEQRRTDRPASPGATTGRKGRPSDRGRTRRGQPARRAPAERRGRWTARFASLLLLAGVGVAGWQWMEGRGLLDGAERGPASPDRSAPEDTGVSLPSLPPSDRVGEGAAPAGSAPASDGGGAVPVPLGRDGLARQSGRGDSSAEAGGESGPPWRSVIGGGITPLAVEDDATLALDGSALDALGARRVRLSISARASGAAKGQLAVSCGGALSCGRIRFTVPREPVDLVLDADLAEGGAAELRLQPGLGGAALSLEVIDVRARGL